MISIKYSEFTNYSKMMSDSIYDKAWFRANSFSWK
jgi:hypothetical protein